MDYLETILVTFGFPQRLTNLLLYCVKIASFLVLINGVPNGPIVPSRGLRERDPLSPYLLLLCTEGLVSLLKNAAPNCTLVSIKVCRRAPQLKHLLFTEDSLVFCKENREPSQTMLEVHCKYARAP